MIPGAENGDNASPTVADPSSAFSRVRIWHAIISSLIAIAAFVGTEVVVIAAKIPRLWRISFGEFVFYLCLAGYVRWARFRQALDLIKLFGSISSKASCLWLLTYVPLLFSNHYLDFVRWSHKPIHDSHVDLQHPIVSVLRVGLAVIIAPIVEEILFRGILLHRASLLVGSNRAIILTSLAFGLGHNALLQASVFGVLMCLLYIRTGSLLVPIMFHILNNGVALIAEIEPAVSHAVARVNPFLHWGALAIIAYIVFLLWPRRGTLLPYFRPNPV